jgi:hypothetical protein
LIATKLFLQLAAMNVGLRDYIVKTFGIARTDSTSPGGDDLPDGIDFVFIAGNNEGLKRVLKVCRPGDKVVPVGDMKLSRLIRLLFDRAGITVVD